MRKKKPVGGDWGKYISNMVRKVHRIYHREDVERELPYMFSARSRDYLTGEKLITIYTNREEDNDLDYGHYKTMTMTYDVFTNNFIEVEEEVK